MWLVFIGVGLYLVTRGSPTQAPGAQSADPHFAPQSFVPQPCPAGTVRWTGGTIGSGSSCISEAEAIARSAGQIVAGSNFAPGEGFLWFRG